MLNLKLLTVVIVFALAGSINQLQSQVFEMQNISKRDDGIVPDFTWTEAGKTKKFSDLIKGKTVFLNFWGTWCGPCRAEIPHIIEIQKDLAGNDFIVVGIALEKDPQKSVDMVSKYAQQTGINYYNFVATGKTRDEIQALYDGVRVVPTTYIIGKDGKILQTIVGARTKNVFLQFIEKAIK